MCEKNTLGSGWMVVGPEVHVCSALLCVSRSCDDCVLLRPRSTRALCFACHAVVMIVFCYGPEVHVCSTLRVTQLWWLCFVTAQKYTCALLCVSRSCDDCVLLRPRSTRALCSACHAVVMIVFCYGAVQMPLTLWQTPCSCKRWGPTS
jgi:hypothetical protein